MPYREYYTVDRNPEEIKALWDWACNECQGQIEHERPYAAGVLAALEYLMGETEARPQNYKGTFTLHNVLRQTEKGQQVGGMGNSGPNQALDASFNGLRPGNPKALLYKSPVFSGDIATGEGGVNNGNEAFGSNADSGSGEG